MGRTNTLTGDLPRRSRLRRGATAVRARKWKHYGDGIRKRGLPRFLQQVGPQEPEPKRVTLAEGEIPPPRSWKECRAEHGFTKASKYRVYRKPGIVAYEVQARLHHARSPGELLAELRQGDLLKWHGNHVATGYYLLGQLCGPSLGPEAMAAIKCLTGALERLGPADLQSKDLAKLIYSWGVLGYRRGSLLQRLCTDAQKRLGEFNAQSIAVMANGLGKLGFQHEGLLTAICEQVPNQLDEFQPQEIASTVYALGKLTFTHKPFLRAVCVHVVERFDEFKAQELSNMIYAMWNLNFRHKLFLTSVCDHIPERLHQFNTQNIANTLSALAGLRFKHPGLIAAMSLHIPTRLKELKKSRAGSIAPIVRSLKTLQSL